MPWRRPRRGPSPRSRPSGDGIEPALPVKLVRRVVTSPGRERHAAVGALRRPIARAFLRHDVVMQHRNHVVRAVHVDRPNLPSRSCGRLLNIFTTTCAPWSCPDHVGHARFGPFTDGEGELHRGGRIGDDGLSDVWSGTNPLLHASSAIRMNGYCSCSSVQLYSGSTMAGLPHLDHLRAGACRCRSGSAATLSMSPDRLS
jgi:hypothetical protein